MTMHSARRSIEDDDHKYIAILAADQDVLVRNRRHLPDVLDDPWRAVVAFEVGGGIESK